MRVVEDLAVEIGGIHVINVCLDTDEAPAYGSVSLDRLYNRANATAARDEAYALAIFGQEPDDTVAPAYQRLRKCNPVPVRVGTCGDGWHTRNLPIDRNIGGPSSAVRRPSPCYRWPAWWLTPCFGGMSPLATWTPALSRSWTAP